MRSNYIKIIGLFILYLVSCGLCMGQWSHDFSSDDLIEWSGDIDNFRVNEDQQLQLNAPGAGDVFINRLSTIDFDTVSFTLFHTLDFAPSDNNKSRIYIALDNQDPTIARGYFIEIGENGSDDALKFYFLDKGTENFIASASMGAMADEPAIVRLKIDIYPDGLWSVKTNYSGVNFTSLELEFIDDQFSLSESQFFGLSCKFSASRADKFFYDDISIQKFVKDNDPPFVTEATPFSPNQILVTFSEPVFDVEAMNISNYNLNNSVGNPSSVFAANSLGNQYLLKFTNEFDASKLYALTISGISDLYENTMPEQIIEFLYADQAQLGDLFISEILFDPYTGGEDFIEIYNGSNKNIMLQGLTIRNDQKEESTDISASFILPPDSYIAFSEEVDFLFQEYKPEQGAKIEFQNLPSFNNDEGNVMLINALGIVLDSFNYHEDQHFQLIDDTEGVSLERVSFEVDASNERNWQSAAKSVRFATPGYENSNTVITIIGEEKFEIRTKTFSPNQDGEDDQMILSYNLEKPGYLANITVHNAAGFKIKELSNNELLGSQGIITWDGTGSDNMISDLGIYIIIGNIFHSDGEVMNFKLTTVLADFID